VHLFLLNQAPSLVKGLLRLASSVDKVELNRRAIHLVINRVEV
jgi:hypothetical protein